MGASRTTKPLTAHPAFPAIVALWFAALLGLGTFVVPPANFEGLVVGTGLDGLVPAAAPPLGDTARLAISGVAALVGALLGLVIALRIRQVQDEPRTRSEAAEPIADSPWLADDDDHASEQDGASAETPNETEFDEPAGGPASGRIPARLARRRSMSDLDDPGSDEEAEKQAERIFQASEIPLGDVEEETTASPEADTRADEGDSSDDTSLDEEDSDLQRFAADRLVAGLPRVRRRNFDDDPLEDWSVAEPVAEEPDLEPEFAAGPEVGASEAQDTESDGPDFAGPDFDGPDFDGPEPVEEAEFDELPTEPAPAVETDDQAAEPAPAQERAPASHASTESASTAEGEAEAEPGTAPLDFAASSLAELVARFDAALLAQRSRAPLPEAQAAEPQPEPARAEQSDDPVIAFLRREADRDRGAPGQPHRERPDDPRAGLRNALDKLDKVSRNS